MLLRVIPMFFFFLDFGVILEKNRKSAKTGKSGHYQAPTPQRREPTPWCRLMPRRGIPRRGWSRCQNGTPRVHHDVALLRRGVATIHNKQFLDFCFQTPRIRTSIV